MVIIQSFTSRKELAYMDDINDFRTGLATCLRHLHLAVRPVTGKDNGFYLFTHKDPINSQVAPSKPLSGPLCLPA